LHRYQVSGYGVQYRTSFIRYTLCLYMVAHNNKHKLCIDIVSHKQLIWHTCTPHCCPI